MSRFYIEERTTINIITKNPSTKKIILGASGYYESIGTYNLTADANVYYKKHSIQLNGGRNFFDGWNAIDNPFYFPKPRIADSTRYKQWKPKEQYFVTLSYGYTFKKINVFARKQWMLRQKKILSKNYFPSKNYFLS